MGADLFHPQASREQLLSISNLGLAHLGDGVYELMVRTHLCLQGKSTNQGLHKGAVAFAAAPAQARLARKILPGLTEEESEIFRRGRNVSPHAVPQHASREDYQTATGLEALFGYLYLNGRTDRLGELFDKMIEGEDHGT